MANKQTEILNTTFRNANDIDAFFQSLGGNNGFIDWWNKNHAQKGYFGKIKDSRGKIKADKGPLSVANRWQNIWNEIEVLFNKPEINLVEFLSLNTIIINESSSFKPISEYYGSSGYSGISYTYTRAGGNKRSYNTLSDAGNKTCFQLFNDDSYVRAHGNKRFANQYKFTSDARWKTEDFPPGNTSKETTGETSFISEADFHKYRGRGFIQLTGRGNYAKIIKFVLDYKGNNSTIKRIRSEWKKTAGSSSVDKIATISTNKDWDELFQKTNNIIAAYSLWAHAERTKYSWITPTDDERKLRKDIRTVSKRIAGSGATSYHDIFEGRMFQQINSILGDENAFQETDEADTAGSNDESNGATSDDGQEQRRSYSDSNNDGQSPELPKVEGLTNFFKPTTAVPPPIKFDAGRSDAHAKKIKNTLGFLPFVSYNGLQIEPKYIQSFSLTIKELLPMVKITFEDQYGIMNDKASPLDDSKITIFLSSRSPALKSIFMRFKIVNFSNQGNTYILTGVSDINRMFLRKYESYSNMSSFQCLQEFAKKSAGFNSNITESDDKMTWINPGMKGADFVKDVISKSYRSDSSFIWCYIDPYYNLNYIDVEEAFKIDNSSDVGIHTIGLNNIEDFKDDNKVINLVLTNDGSMADSNHYFDKWTLINNSTSISLERGYLNKVKFFDLNKISFNIFDIDSITSEGDKTIIMKASPQDEEYFKEHVTTTYVGKLDSANMHENYNYSVVQNKQNIEDVQKVGIRVEMPSPNFNLFRFQKVKVLLSNKGATPTHGLINHRLSGDWLIIDIQYSQLDGKFKQIVTLVKRELNLSPDELSSENPSNPKVESGSLSEDTTNPSESTAVDEDGDGVPDSIPEDDIIEWDWEIEWSNSKEIETFFRQYNTNGFVGWFAKEFGNEPIFNDNPRIEVGDASPTEVGGAIKHDEGSETPINKQRWTKIWNAIPTLYNDVTNGEDDNLSKQVVNGIEYLALNTLIYNLAGTDFKPIKESKNVQESFREYNELSDNETAYKLFNDEGYQQAFSNQPFSEILGNTNDNRWKGDTFPIGFSGNTSTDKEISIKNNGYITNADFFKFMKRGILPVIGREKYLDIVAYISNYEGENKILKQYNEEWTTKSEQINSNIEVTQDVKNTNRNRKTRATVSTVKDWDKILLDGDINPAVIASISNFFFNKKSQHVFDSGRAEDKVFKSIQNIAKAVKEEIPDFDVDNYILQVKEQISFLDKKELPATKGVQGSPNPIAQKPSSPADISSLKSGGKFDSFRYGKKIGNEDTVIYKGVLVAKKVAPALLAMVRDAKKDGINISVNSAFRTNEDQTVNGRRKSGQNYLYDIWTHTGNNRRLPGKKHYTYPGHNPENPPTSRKGNLAAVPGTSNHQNGIALDLNTGAKSGSSVYEWLVANAWKYGFIRAVRKERWHWEYRPGERMFSKVDLEHNVYVKAAGKKENTWDNLPQKYGLA